MFSRALFKQSCKANGTMWGIITFAVCFMLACVMLISGNGNIGEVKNSIEDTIITKEIDSRLQDKALSAYKNAQSGLEYFDSAFEANAEDVLSYLVWCSKMPTQETVPDAETLAAATKMWHESCPEMKTETGKAFAENVSDWMAKMPSAEGFGSVAEYAAAMEAWQKNSPATSENAVTLAYTDAAEALRLHVISEAEKEGFSESSDECEEMLGSVMYALNPNGMFDDFFTENDGEAPEDYDVMSVVEHISAGDAKEWISSDERREYTEKRAEGSSAVFIAGNMTKSESIDSLTEALSSYGVTKEKFDSFGYTYAPVKNMAETAIVTYRGRLEYELELLLDEKADGAFATEEEYIKALDEKKEDLQSDISQSFLSTLPEQVSDALEEIGQADLYTLIVGSIFYKLAGLLLPIIYMIMASNNLVSGQVDSGSMAYVLSTSTKRSTVVFTQAVYLIGSLLAMFSLTTATGCVCLSLITEEVELTYGNLVLLNVGAFLVLLALSGLCFFTSCVFDRSKRSMAIGGGLSIFALVAAMLGLFGSPVIPSVVRLDALNNFNYATIISLFDVISIIEGTDAFIGKFVILGCMGVLGYILGSIRFTKKDLPL